MVSLLGVLRSSTSHHIIGRGIRLLRHIVSLAALSALRPRFIHQGWSCPVPHLPPGVACPSHAELERTGSQGGHAAKVSSSVCLTPGEAPHPLSRDRGTFVRWWAAGSYSVPMQWQCPGYLCPLDRTHLLHVARLRIANSKHDIHDIRHRGPLTCNGTILPPRMRSEALQRSRKDNNFTGAK
ncbi:hypothetical protein NDU88_001950 [Pleurodeles waltl]|uniref:Uncharacterized protein n=1 Tax=Pleurodeles waltl TaxID=8319 RepID=A0AAV7NC82_PLEWA|nr:hypothetical protein NDU88_001950 [Pleurodeles waltl]